jgi:hypothetical protein
MPTTTHPDAWPPERLDRLARAMYPVIFGHPAPGPAAGRCDYGALPPLPPMDEIDHFGWQMIADETIDWAFTGAWH